jgi:hypothetical protein
MACLVCLASVSTLAQSGPDRFEVGAQVTVTTSSEFDASDAGFGGRFSWSAVGPLGLDSEINFYPNDFPDKSPFSRGRVEGLFGATVGPRVGPLRPFAKARSGFLIVERAARPFACILIFPPPLSCQLGGGRTLPAFDLGGGVELFLNQGTFVRLEIGDRALKYPGLVLDANGVVRSESFFSHDLRFSAGAGLRF